MISISIANDNDNNNWNEFVRDASVSNSESCGHWVLWQWRTIISKAFGHKPYYLIARVNNNIAGVLPIFHVKSILFGSALISVPYLNGGGVIATNQEVESALIKYATELGKELNTNYVELRFRKQLEDSTYNLKERSHKVAMLLKLQQNPEELFGTFPAKLRSQIRRPTKSGIVTQSFSGENHREISAFYDVFAHNMRDLGTPVYPKRLFIETAKHFGSDCKIIISRLNTKPIACGITIGGNSHGSNSHVEILWASTLRNHNSLSPNMVLYWEAIKNACENNYQFFDFGRSSPDSGTYKFKKQWGAEPHKLYWYYEVNKGSIPDINPKSSKYSLLVNTWKRLPIPLAKVIGAWVTRSLP